MRIFLWVAAGLVAALFLLCAFPLLTLPGFRGTRQGKDLSFLLLVFGIVLGILLFNLLRT